MGPGDGVRGAETDRDAVPAPGPADPDAGAAADAGARPAGTDEPVPDALRALLVRAAADVLGGMEAAEVPTALLAVRRFAPRRRATTGAVPLWNALRSDEGFRARVARVWVAAHDDPAGAEPARDGTGEAAHDDSADGAAARTPAPDLDAAAGAWLQGRPWRP
ncbi:hypothetical protein AB6N23_13320, partial [Cellulomonas sp. 179-A 9B4 NHS]